MLTFQYRCKANAPQRAWSLFDWVNTWRHIKRSDVWWTLRALLLRKRQAEERMKRRLLRSKHDQREEKFGSWSKENRHKQQYTVFEHWHKVCAQKPDSLTCRSARKKVCFSRGKIIEKLKIKGLTLTKDKKILYVAILTERRESCAVTPDIKVPQSCQGKHQSIQLCSF